MADAVSDYERVAIYFIDTAYDHPTGEIERETLRTMIEVDHSLQLSDANIGSSADVPAFATWLQSSSIPYLAGALYLFFKGKNVAENLNAWMSLATKIFTYLERPVVLDRNGAAAIAIAKIVEGFQGEPSRIILEGYRLLHFAETGDWPNLSVPISINEVGDVADLGFAAHLFAIRISDDVFLALVQGNDVKVTRLK